MDWDKEPSLKEFAEIFLNYLQDIGCMNNDQGYVYSHDIDADITVHCIDPDDDQEYEVVGIETDSLMGCGCASGIRIKIKRIRDSNIS